MSPRKKIMSTSAATPDIDWQDFQLDKYGNIVDSYDDYVDHYTRSEKYSGDPLLDNAMRTMDRLVNAIEVGDTQPMQLAMARDVIYVFQDMKDLVEDARETVKEIRGLRSDLYASIDRENAKGNRIKELEEKLRIIKDSDIKSLRKVVNVVRLRSNNDKVESEEKRGPKVTFNPEFSKWPGNGPIETWTPPFYR